MILFNKKKIIFIMILITLSITIYNVNEKILKNQLNEKTVQTIAFPTNNKVIILDAGHGRRRWRSYK